METLSPFHLHILVVSDTVPSRDALSSMVRALGHEATESLAGSDAQRHLARRDIDLVLIEYTGSGSKVPDFARDLPGRPADRWLPVILVGAGTPGHSTIDALHAGADDHLRSPVVRASLEVKLARIGRMLEHQARAGSGGRHHRDILDNILDPVLTLDEDERIIDANLAACRVFAAATAGGPVGLSIEQVTGRSLDALVLPGIVELQQSDGIPYPAEVSASGWHEGAAARTTLVLRNLKERMRTEQMRDEFLATVSHELRTPLTSVLGAVSLLASGAFGALPQPATTLVEVAQRNGERLSKLIDDILDLTKLEGDRMVMHLRPQPLVPLVREAIAANQAYADRSGIDLRYDFPLETTDATAHVRIDADRFLQVMANLLSNAIKHSPKGESVLVRVCNQGDGCTVHVIDRGPGIDLQFRGHLFEKFSQADTSDRRALGGTGLGLYISRLMVERMGGRIDAKSDNGNGATFELWFPLLSGASLKTPGHRLPRSHGEP